MAESSGVRETEALIRGEIARSGTISVARFMEIALYEPGSGYYRRQCDPFGKAGDFYTAGQLQPVFGELVASHAAAQKAAMVKDGGECGEAFSILELGAGRGELRSALSGWDYRGFDWKGDALPESMCGFVLANEFFDALPVHMLRRREGKWKEVGVCVLNDRLFLTETAFGNPALNDYALRFGSFIPDEGVLEVNLNAGQWFESVSRIQAAGNFLVIDYGYTESELARLAEGTLMTYRHHRASADFLLHPGERDITAHVNFSYLKELGVRHGYEVAFEGLLNAWMHGVWSEDELSRRWERNGRRWRLQWKHLFFGMGERFRVLELRKRSQKRKAPGF